MTVAEGGWDKRTFRLGDALLVRLPSARCYAAQALNEQAWLPVLAPWLPLRIPAPVALGRPALGYSWPWSVYLWLQGETATDPSLAEDPGFGAALAGFLSALHRIDATDGPAPGEHSFHRGGSLAAYDAQTRQAVAALGDGAEARAAEQLWNSALSTLWERPPVWVHGDLAPRNLLVDGRRLSAVIDFGALSAGDPACDLAIAWSFLRGDGRAAFRDRLALDPATWARGRGWALWKALILATGVEAGPAADVESAPAVLEEVLITP